MAYDKVVDSTILDSGLSSIANSIREKAGTDEALVFPNGFVSAIDEISIGVDTLDATATASDILYGKNAYVNGEKIEGEIRYKKYTGEIVSNIVGTQAYASLVTDDFLKEHRNDENLSIVVTFDFSEPIAYTILRNIAFNKSYMLQGWGGTETFQYITRYDGNSNISSQASASQINCETTETTGCLQLTEEGELRIYSNSAINYAIRPSNFTVEVRW